MSNKPSVDILEILIKLYAEQEGVRVIRKPA